MQSSRRDAMNNRQRILDAARDLFATQGVEVVTMHQIGQAAGVGQGTLYRRYGCKGEICMALLGERIQQLQDEVNGWAAEQTANLVLIARLLTRLGSFSEANAPLLGAMNAGEQGGSLYRSQMYGWLHKVVAGLLRRAVVAGECAPLDAECLADGLLAPLNIDLYLFQRHELGFSEARITAAALRLLAGLQRP